MYLCVTPKNNEIFRDLSFSKSYISDCLEIVFENAMIINPINAFWLRSFADFRFGEISFIFLTFSFFALCWV